MKFPSFLYLQKQAVDAFRRFPFTILSASLAVAVALYLIEYEDHIRNAFPYINLLLCGYLGVPVFMSVRIFAERKGLSLKRQWWLYGAGVLLLAAVYFYLPDSEDTLNTQLPYIRYTIFAIAAHLLVSFVPFVTNRSVNGFWNYNKSLFLRFLLSVLYSAFFCTGIILALQAVKTLFEVDIEEETFFQVFIFIAGVFNTWFFVAGVPKDLSGLETDTEYPRGLRTFILYVLIPLLALYLIILYSYSARIVFLWDWPKGIITYMIISVAVLGILAMLLAYPYSQQEHRNPLTFLTRGYYFVLIPLIAMLFIAIGIRIGDYGVTINRYITVLLGIWLTAISGYFIFRGKNIKLIPVSLFAFILLTSFGPWSIFQVSERSQTSRLRAILEDSGILVDGRIVHEPVWIASDTTWFALENEKINESRITRPLHNEVKSIVDYLGDYHGFSEIRDWYDQNPTQIASVRDVSESLVYMELMGLDYIYYYEEDGISSRSFNIASGSGLRDVRGYDYAIRLHHWDFDSAQQLGPFEDVDLTVSLNDSTVILQSDTSRVAVLDIRKQAGILIEKYADSYSYEIPESEMTVKIDNEWISARFIMDNLYAGEGQKVTSYNGELMFRLKQ